MKLLRSLSINPFASSNLIRSMVKVDLKVVTDSKLEHASNFSITVPAWTKVSEVIEVIATRFYQIASDISLFKDKSLVESDEFLPVNATLRDCGYPCGAEASPPACVIWVVSKGKRYGYSIE